MKQKREDIIKELTSSLSLFNESHSDTGMVRECISLMNKDKHCIDVLGSQLIESAIGHIAGIIAVSNSTEMTRKYQDMLFYDVVPFLLCELTTDRGKSNYTETQKRMTGLVYDYFGTSSKEDSYIENCMFYMEKYLYNREYWSTEKIKSTVTSELLNTVREYTLSLFMYTINYIPHEHDSKWPALEQLLDVCHKFYTDTTSIKRSEPNYKRICY